jgi:hypothetical protein
MPWTITTMAHVATTTAVTIIVKSGIAVDFADFAISHPLIFGVNRIHRKCVLAVTASCFWRTIVHRPFSPVGFFREAAPACAIDSGKDQYCAGRIKRTQVFRAYLYSRGSRCEGMYSSGNLARLAAILRASSLVSIFAAERRPAHPTGFWYYYPRHNLSGRKAMEWFKQKTSIAGYEISNWIIVLGAIIIVLLVFQNLHRP